MGDEKKTRKKPETRETTWEPKRTVMHKVPKKQRRKQGKKNSKE